MDDYEIKKRKLELMETNLKIFRTLSLINDNIPNPKEKITWARIESAKKILSDLNDILEFMEVKK